MAETFKTTKRVEFRDTDAAGLMHFSTYFTYMEEAEHELLRSLGTSVIVANKGHSLSWPRVAATAQYTAPVRFEDELLIEISISRLGTSSVTYQHAFSVAGKPVASGSITTVCCKITSSQAPTAQEIPAELRTQLESYLQHSTIE
ncbi:acyl-CoA thioesterase [Pirellulaceae bacterium]|jgi:acyl-CoA thioester hydrolase|nr:acyl-CoA thioesterase [Pirellulaceae bacterium]